jgi:hypothetical protein
MKNSTRKGKTFLQKQVRLVVSKLLDDNKKAQAVRNAKYRSRPKLVPIAKERSR